MHVWDLVKAVKIPGIHSFATPMLYWNNISGKCFCSCFIIFCCDWYLFLYFSFSMHIFSISYHPCHSSPGGRDLCCWAQDPHTCCPYMIAVGAWGEIVWKQHVYEGNKVDLQLKYCSPCKSLLIAQLHFCFVGPWQEFSQDAFVPWGTPIEFFLW